MAKDYLKKVQSSLKEKFLRIDQLTRLIRKLKSKVLSTKTKKGTSSENWKLKNIVIELNARISELESSKKSLIDRNLKVEAENRNLRKDIMKVTNEKDLELEKM